MLQLDAKQFDEPVQVEGLEASYKTLITVTSQELPGDVIDLWGECTTCEETVRVESHSHEHVCELDDVSACGWLDPAEIGAEIGNDLIPPETVGDWDFSLYVVGPTGSNYGKRTLRRNGEIVHSDKLQVLPEVRAPRDLEELEAKYQCGYCKKRFQNRFVYVYVHACEGLIESRVMLDEHRNPSVKPEKRRVNSTIAKEAAAQERWFGADRNRVPSELPKLNKALRGVDPDAKEVELDETAAHIELIREYMAVYGESFHESAERLMNELASLG